MKKILTIVFAISIVLSACNKNGSKNVATVTDATTSLKPLVTTEKVFDDSDDPAIYIDSKNPGKSFILGTDKHKKNGGIYVFGLDGKIDRTRTKTGMKRVNNIDIAYGLSTGNSSIDIAVATERDINALRVLKLPEMEFVDQGGIQVFAGDTARHPMGIALYTRPSDNAIFAIVGRKSGPKDNYLEQYLLTLNEDGNVSGKLVRKFGNYSGKKEIESICVDSELGYVYYSDEQFGIRKYYADPEKGNEELALFGQGEYLEDNEGISIYKLNDKTGYILVSNQSANKFNIYAREGEPGNPHKHRLISSIPVSTSNSDGSDVTSVTLPGFPGGLFVAMSDDQTFQLYSWKQLAEKGKLKMK